MPRSEQVGHVGHQVGEHLRVSRKVSRREDDALSGQEARVAAVRLTGADAPYLPAVQDDIHCAGAEADLRARCLRSLDIGQQQLRESGAAGPAHPVRELRGPVPEAIAVVALARLRLEALRAGGPVGHMDVGQPFHTVAVSEPVKGGPAVLHEFHDQGGIGPVSGAQHQLVKQVQGIYRRNASAGQKPGVDVPDVPAEGAKFLQLLLFQAHHAGTGLCRCPQRGSARVT